MIDPVEIVEGTGPIILAMPHTGLEVPDEITSQTNRTGMAPSAEEIEARRRKFHASYHDALSEQIDQLLARHRMAVLSECHSIRSRIPFLFDGVLPDSNIGYSSALNGRFEGGRTPRHYGQPDRGVHAVQMELAHTTYLDSATPPFAYFESRAARLRPHLSAIRNQSASLERGEP